MKLNLSEVIYLSLSVVISIIGIIGGLVCLSVPYAYDGNDVSRFSAMRAALWIKEISKEPHSVYDNVQHELVMKYLLSELDKLGLRPSIREYTVSGNETEAKNLKIFNINAVLEGKLDDAILLVTHYDSAYSLGYSTGKQSGGVSYGASDAGYGIGTILETIRAIKAQNKPLENDLQVLITDGEEIGALGAKKELEKNISAYDKVKLVINVEARGVKGPAIMFETGTNNSSVMNYFIGNATMPFSYSYATDIYRLMPITQTLHGF